MTTQLTAGYEPLPGYRLVEPLGRGSFGEVWKASSPGGGQVALKFIPLHTRATDIERRALDFFTSVRHPNLLALFGSWQIDSFLVIGMELADRSLLSRYEEAAEGGLPGIPFAELLEYLDEAARGLDYLNARRHPHPQGGTVQAARYVRVNGKRRLSYLQNEIMKPPERHEVIFRNRYRLDH
jgi:serine/threonine protein kinase